MAINIAQFFEADRLSVTAGEAMAQGQVVSLENNGGLRKVMIVDNANDLVPGGAGVVVKFSTDPDAVDSSTAPSSWGSRIETIALGDDVVLVSDGYITYDAADVDATLDPDRGGVLPTVKQRLGIKAGKWSTVGASGAIATPTIARVWEVAGKKITIKLTVPEA
jgi:hypothetical protein